MEVLLEVEVSRVGNASLGS